MWSWLDGPGAAFKDPLPRSTNYLTAYGLDGTLLRMKEQFKAKSGGDEEKKKKRPDIGEPIPPETVEDMYPFPPNRLFRSMPVLSEEFKDEIYHRVVELKKSVRSVSMDLNVDMSRVGAVVRLKSVEKQWIEQGKPLATPYAKAVLAMLPQTPFIGGEDQAAHEAINDLPVHHATRAQIFYPVSESRQFTRRDAGRVFKRGLLPAEDRIPHPRLVELVKMKMAGEPNADQIIQEKMAQDEEAVQAQKEKMRQRKERNVRRVQPGGNEGKYEFRFQNISVEQAGKTGRGRQGVGARYGIPAQDRKRGQVKIPTKVE
ncbi:hypothetical protein MMC07_005457 [Pseudocyphellaria aurata]|nr:hypothetical protein [Pseudocyphellaria aurata]